MPSFFSELFDFFGKIFNFDQLFGSKTNLPAVLTDDEKVFIEKNFKPADQATAIKVLETVKSQDEVTVSAQKKYSGLHRVIRSTLVGSDGSLERLKMIAGMDNVDAILTGEYAHDSASREKYVNGVSLSPLYDLRKPFDKDGKPAPAQNK